MDIKELVDNKTWLVADCECKYCYCTWIGILRQNHIDKLKCYNCGKMTGEATYIYTPEEVKNGIKNEKQ